MADLIYEVGTKNFLYNPYMLNSFANWQVSSLPAGWGTVTYSTTTNPLWAPATSVRSVTLPSNSNGTSSFYYLQSYSATEDAGYISIIPGEKYSFQARVYQTNANLTCRVGVAWYNSANVEISAFAEAVSYIRPISEWNCHMSTFTAPATAAKAKMRVYMYANPGATGTVYLTGLQMELGVPTSFAAGSMGRYHRWMGPVNASPTLRESILMGGEGFISGNINLHLNPSMEIFDTNNWWSEPPGNVVTISHLTKTPYSGNYYYRYTLPSNTTPVATIGYGGYAIIRYPNFPRRNYDFWGSIAVRSSESTVKVQMQITNTDNTAIVTTQIFTVDQDRWTRCYLAQPVSTDITKTVKYIIIYVLQPNKVPNSYIELDGVMITKGPHSSYFDGASIGDEYYWLWGTGVNNASSIREAVPETASVVVHNEGRGIDNLSDPTKTPREDSYVKGYNSSSNDDNKLTPVSLPPYFYTAASGLLRVTPQLFLADQNNKLGADISRYILEGEVQMDLEREIKSIFNFRMSSPFQIDPYNNYVAPFLILQYPDGRLYRYQVGLFATVPFNNTYTAISSEGEMQAQDITSKLLMRSFSSTYNVEKGRNVVREVEKILAGQGFNRHNIPHSTRKLADFRSWPPGTPVLNVINDLLTSIAYYTLWASRYGVFRSMPYINIRRAEPVKYYTEQEKGVIIEPFETKPELSTLANHIIIIKDNTEGAPTIVVRKNEKKNSPTSIQNLGLITRVINDSNFVDVTSMNATADRLIEEWGNIQIVGTLNTFPEPWHNFHEVYDIRIADRNGKKIDEAWGRFWATGWNLSFDSSGGEMSHTVKRIEAFGDIYD